MLGRILITVIFCLAATTSSQQNNAPAAVETEQLLSSSLAPSIANTVIETTDSSAIPFNNHTIVTTKYGDVHGFLHLIGVAPAYGQVTADVYLGIPFAQPPIGPLRFEKPLPPTMFKSGKLIATRFARACASFAPLSISPIFDEDCLYLNIIAPSKRAYKSTGFPVVIWIHGGGFSSGAARIYGYKEMAANFVSRGIVVVTIQYRLGMFGFMSSGDNVLPGNLALWDQRAALIWVHDNIRHFGGDPKRITLWGENAGAASVGALSLSKTTRDLFNQSIEMSGSVYSDWALSNSVVDTSHDIAKHLDCPITATRKMKECLKEKTTEEIALAGAKLGWLRDDINFIRMQPRLDGDFFDSDLDTLLVDAPKKPTIQGFNSQESMVLTMPFPHAPMNSSLIIKKNELDTFNRDQLIHFIKKTVVPAGAFGERTNEARDAIVRFYADRHNETLDGPADSRFYLTRYTQILSDLQYVVPTLTEVSKKSKNNWPIYLYLINYMNQLFQLPVLGTFQTYEFPYLFGFSVIGHFDFDDDDRRFQQTLVLSLANFIKTGNPSTQPIEWLPVDEAHPFAFLDIGPQSMMRDDLMADRLTFWRAYVSTFGASWMHNKGVAKAEDVI